MEQQILQNYNTSGHPTAFAGRDALKQYYGDQVSTKFIEDALNKSETYGIKRESAGDIHGTARAQQGLSHAFMEVSHVLRRFLNRVHLS